MEKRNSVPQFGNWEENVHYTTYFEKARPSNNNGPSNPNPNQMAADLNKKPPPAAVRDLNADLRSRVDPPRPRSSVSQRSTASEPPQAPASGQRQSAVSWRNTNREEMGEVRQNDVHSSSRQNHGGRGTRQVAAPVRNLPYYEYEGHRYGSSAPATPQHRYGGAPEEMMPMHKGSVPKFGVWNANDSDTNFTQVFDQVKGKKLEKDKAKQPTGETMQRPTETPTPTPQQRQKQIFMPEKPRQTPQHKPTFLPEVPPRRVSTTSPSYDLHVTPTKDNKSFPRCWPFWFSSKRGAKDSVAQTI